MLHHQTALTVVHGRKDGCRTDSLAIQRRTEAEHVELGFVPSVEYHTQAEDWILPVAILAKIAPGMRTHMRTHLPSSLARLNQDRGNDLIEQPPGHFIMADALDVLLVEVLTIRHACRPYAGSASSASPFSPSPFSWLQVCVGLPVACHLRLGF